MENERREDDRTLMDESYASLAGAIIGGNFQSGGVKDSDGYMDCQSPEIGDGVARRRLSNLNR